VRTVEQWARIDVDDEGAGIPPEFLAHIFEPYRQRMPGPGLGLGLAIVRELVELHGGHVEAHSPGVGRGARFTVLLPRHDPHDDTDPAFTLSVTD
jgi:two-component system, chemotaxis family, CheB/CheR fusion protein